MTLQVLGFSGSLRKESYNTKLLRNAQRLAPDTMHLEIYDVSDLPMYNQDLVTDQYPQPVEKLRKAIRAVDALVFATPEYNYSVTPVTKNTIDWASRPDVGPDKHPNSPLFRKPIAIMGAGGRWGGVRVQLQMVQIAAGTSMIPVPEPKVFVRLYPDPPFDEEGNLTDDVSIELVQGLLGNLVTMTYQLGGVSV
jgi:chromate reductase